MTLTPSPTTAPTFATLLRTSRLAAGLTQRALAERSGLSVRDIGDLERGLKHTPCLETVRMLAEGLGFGPDAPEPAALLAARGASAAGITPALERRRLPVPPTPLIGRERELATLIDLLSLEGVRLLTLVGPGGVGKTRLVEELLANIAGHYVDGAWFVSLAAIRDPLLVPIAIADALGIQPRGERPVVDVLAEVLRDRSVLLVLDNMEHLLSATPAWLVDLLKGRPRLSVVVTSRVALRLRGEQRFSVEPLNVPTASDGVQVETAAVKLFLQRATSICPGFAPTYQDLAVVADICRRLDGLPLAIELAAARVGVLSLREIRERVPHRLDLLSNGPRDVSTRQQSLNDTIAWSYDLLNSSEQLLFRHVSVFQGGFTVDAAISVVSGTSEAGDEGRTIDGLHSLIDQSLIRRVLTDSGESRFEMLETIREFAGRQLELNEESIPTRDRHAAWCLALSRSLWPAWLTSRQQDAASRLDSEHNNIRAALDWLVKRDDRHRFVQLVASLWMHWFVRGHFSEGQRWLKPALQLTTGEQSIERIRVLMGTYAMALAQGKSLDVARLELEMRELWQLPEAVGVDSPSIPIALATRFRGDHAEAMRIYKLEVENLLDLAASQPAATGLAGVAMVNMSSIVLDHGDPARARNLAEKSLRLQREAGFRWGVADALSQLGMIALQEGDITEARRLYYEALECGLEDGDPWHVAEALGKLAVIAASAGNAHISALIFGKSEQLHQLIDRDVRASFSEQEKQTMGMVRDQLGVNAFDALREEGRARSVEAIVADSHQVLAAETSMAARGSRLGLSSREVEVLRLLAAGRTDREIADALFISRRTVTSHVSSIFTKLGVANRVQAAMMASQKQLL